MKYRTADLLRWLAVAAVIVLCVVISYYLALAGEPQSLWLWRDVLEVI